MSAPATILVVDDEAHMRRLLQFTLAKTGAQLRLAACGQEALAQAAAAPVDLMIVDYVLPDMDGFATVRAFRAVPGHAGVPVIMLTSRGQADLRDLAAETGVDQFLTKPFSPSALTQHVQRLLAEPRRSPAV